jgi:hypothetical protein
VSVLGVREALMINGVLAIAAHVAIGRAWMKSPLPEATDFPS